MDVWVLSVESGVYSSKDFGIYGVFSSREAAMAGVTRPPKGAEWHRPRHDTGPDDGARELDDDRAELWYTVAPYTVDKRED